MPRRFHSIDELATAAGVPARDGAIATPGRMLAALPDRCVRYSFSDATVGRDMHTIAPDAWDLTNFNRNPVFLWAHCDDELPVGRVEDLATEAGRLTGLVRYADHEFAETVYQLVKGSFLNATSTGWLPLEYRAANDRKRPGGLDFTRVELLEISQVPVPALPTALVTARKAGVDTRPLYDWAERLLDRHDFAVIGKLELQQLRKAAKTPAGRRGDASGGKMTQNAETPPAEPAKPAATPPSAAPRRDFAALGRKLHKRDLYVLGDLAYFLANLENLYDRVEDEAEREGDGSEMPAKLRAWIDDGNRLLLEYAGEEVQEQIDGTQAHREPYYWSAKNLGSAIARALDDLGVTRAGKKYSAETVRCLRAIAEHTGAAHEALSALIDEADDVQSQAEPDDAARAAATEARKTRAAALKARLPA